VLTSCTQKPESLANDVGLIDHLQNVNLVRDIPFHDLDSSCIALKRLAVCWVLKWRQACTERFAVPKQKSKDRKYKNEQISTYPNTRMHPIVIGRTVGGAMGVCEVGQAEGLPICSLLVVSAVKGTRSEGENDTGGRQHVCVKQPLMVDTEQPGIATCKRWNCPVDHVGEQVFNP